MSFCDRAPTRSPSVRSSRQRRRRAPEKRHDALPPQRDPGVALSVPVLVAELLFVAFAVTTTLALPALRAASRFARGGGWRWLRCQAAGVAAAYVFAPSTNRIFYDEQIYQHAGQNMADLRRTQMCNYGIVGPDNCSASPANTNKEPYGYPYLLSVGYRLFGTSDALAHRLNRWLHGLLTLVLAMTIVRWTRRPSAGMVAALIISMIPEQLRWSATAAAEPISRRCSRRSPCSRPSSSRKSALPARCCGSRPRPPGPFSSGRNRF